MIQINTYNQLQRIYKFLREQREKQKFYKYTEISATFFLVCILLIFAIRPSVSAITGLIGEIKSKEEMSVKMTTKIKSIINAQESYSQIQEKYPIIESSLPDNPNFYQASVSLSSVSRQSNVALNQLSINLKDDNKKETLKNIGTYGMTMNGKGDFSSIVNYIDGVLKSRRLIDLNGLQLSTDEKNKNPSAGDINILLNSNFFYLKE
jgi:hypothetical protein